jgi:hypothetical protein
VKPPPGFGRPRFDIADIVRAERPGLEVQGLLSAAQRRALSAIEVCRTAALGGHVDVCRSCGYEHPAYNSCRNRHCPKCQGLAQEKWITARSERILPVRHFHVVFTMPAELRPLARFAPEEVFAALFQVASKTLLELGASRIHARLGATMVLHTWTRDLRFHPHVHAIVTAGGFDAEQGVWNPSSKNYLFPINVMGALLRGKMMSALRRLHADGIFARFDAFDDPEGFDRLMAKVAKKKWLVYAKKPFREARHVLEYLGRYTHRVAISNSRLVKVTKNAVIFRTKNGGTVTLPPDEFVRRFSQHVLPDRFHKIRHYGLYAGCHAENILGVVRELLSPGRDGPTAVPETWQAHLERLTGRDVDQCPRCNGKLEHVPLDKPAPISNRGPPRTEAA